jgi:hypothetical protein
MSETLRATIAELEDIIRAIPTPTNLKAEISFRFNPFATGGMEGLAWQGLLTIPPEVICDYGYSLEDAACKILDRFKFPEKYPIEED